jgi:ATP-dependent Clp protease protease subunit
MNIKPFVSSRVLDVLAAAERTLELTIYGDIGENFWTGEGITPKSVKDQMDSAGAFTRMVVRINSPGGNAYDGVAIYNLIRAQKKPVSVMVDGVAASAASIIAMCGDSVTMGTGAMMMVHNPSVMMIGCACDLREAADFLDKVGASMGEIYTAKSGKTAEEVKAIMDAETWMSAQEAVDLGFATDIADGSPDAVAAARTFPALAKLKNLPDSLKAQIEPKREPEPTPPPVEAPVPEAPKQEAPQASEAAQPLADNLTVIRERFKITHKRRN